MITKEITDRIYGPFAPALDVWFGFEVAYNTAEEIAIDLTKYIEDKIFEALREELLETFGEGKQFKDADQELKDKIYTINGYLNGAFERLDR